MTTSRNKCYLNKKKHETIRKKFMRSSISFFSWAQRSKNRPFWQQKEFLPVRRDHKIGSVIRNSSDGRKTLEFIERARESQVETLHQFGSGNNKFNDNFFHAHYPSNVFDCTNLTKLSWVVYTYNICTNKCRSEKLFLAQLVSKWIFMAWKVFFFSFFFVQSIVLFAQKLNIIGAAKKMFINCYL